MHKSVFLFAGFFLAIINSNGQGNQLEKKLDKLIAGYIVPSQPGCEVLVARHGQIVYKKAFGSANLELNVPLSTGMVFNLASITKQFTAVAILQLMEQGKISLNDSLQKFVPDFPSKGHTITIEHLLTHTSGIKDYLQLNFSGQNMERWDFTPKQVIDSFKNYPLNFIPGARFSYSNSGYYLLGYIIEKISGKRYQNYIIDNLLKPLGMAHTCFDSNGNIIPGRVNGYYKDGADYKNPDFWSPTIEYAAGGLISNVDDLLKWHNGLYSYQLLKKETLQKAFTPFRLSDGKATDYGYGWFAKTNNGIQSIEHEGGLPGFRTNEIYYPGEDVFIAILCNFGTAPIEDLSAGISAVALGKSLQSDVKVDPAILDKYVGVYKLSIDTNRTVTIQRTNDGLIAHFSPTQTKSLLFESETGFQFKNMLGVSGEFVVEEGKVTKFYIYQNGRFEWTRSK
ncbi:MULTISPECIES: serine hydrolase [Niastella]|uniref:Serine hydrolase n=1 Tax=Niastella soli TaxID=2821487 RepID=A0ABS3YXK3_9BACT|nr:serine hydrolase [Niastella soli]MBO9202150.1 serine hydrolase [Niastella soli]